MDQSAPSPAAPSPAPAAPQQPPVAYPQQSVVPGKTLGIIGFILAIIAPIAGLIVSIVALIKSKKANVKNGLALAGIIIGAVLTILWTLIGTVMVVVAFNGISAIANACAEQDNQGTVMVGNVMYNCSTKQSEGMMQ